MDRMKFRELQKTMTFKEKVNYLWYYYKLHMIVVCFLAITTTYLISETVNSKEMALNVVIVGETINAEQLTQLDQQLDKSLIKEEERESAEVSLQVMNLNSEGTSQQSVAESQKFAAQLAAGSIHVLIADKNLFRMLAEEGTAFDLGEITDLSKINEEEHSFIRSSSGQVIGISTSGMEDLKQVTSVEEKILFVPLNAERTDYVSELVQFLTAS